MDADTATRVLIIEDDAKTAAGMVRGLRALGFGVALCTNGHEGEAAVLAGAADVVVLDLMLPERSGFEVLERVRHRNTLPVIVLTARGDLDDRLRAFALGAADYVVKPFFLEELVARIRARTGRAPAPPRRIVTFGNAEVDLDARTLRVAGEPVALTPTELAILGYLVERPHRAVTRAALTEHVLASFGQADARTVDSHVARLRKKLGAAATHVVTVWSIGYRFEPSVMAP